MWRPFAGMSLLFMSLLPANAQALDFVSDIQPLLSQFCVECHQGAGAEAEVDLTAIQAIDPSRGQTRLWQRIHEMLQSRQMPPPDARQPSDQQHHQLTDWVGDLLQQQAAKRAGDPGPVTLRRLSNRGIHLHDSGFDGRRIPAAGQRVSCRWRGGGGIHQIPAMRWSCRHRWSRNTLMRPSRLPDMPC